MRTLRAIPAAVLKGFAEWQALLALLCVSWLVAAIAVAPDLWTLLRFYGHAPLADGRPLLSAELLLGIARAYPPGVPPLRALAVGLLVALPLTLFVTAGVVWRAWTVDRFALVEFIGECTRGVGRVLRTLLWSLPLLAVCVGLGLGAGSILRARHEDTFFTQPQLAWLTDRPTAWALGHLALVALLWSLWRMTLDTSRVMVHAQDLRQTRWAVWRALRLVLVSPGAWLGYALLGIVEVAAVLLVMRVHASLPEGSTALAWLALLVAQLVLLVRAGFQVATTAFAADLVRRTHPAAVAAGVAAAPVMLPGLAAAPEAAASEAVAAPGEPPEAEAAPGEPFELLIPKHPPRSDSTSEMPMVDADLVEDEPRSGGKGGGG
ncbi:MAG TPA: hypothetical protein VK454_08330 [Myxococcaceae bacterium]|nr:hypothetical protein [Myxococcaceae bacterium]